MGRSAVEARQTKKGTTHPKKTNPKIKERRLSGVIAGASELNLSLWEWTVKIHYSQEGRSPRTKMGRVGRGAEKRGKKIKKKST